MFGDWLPALSAQQNGSTKKPREQGQSDRQLGKQGEASEATDSGFSRTTSTTLSRSWRLSPFNRKMRSTESDSTARTRSISNKQDKGQFSSHFTKLDDRGTRRRARGAAAGPQNGSVRTAGHGDQGQVNPLRPGPQRSQGSGGTQGDESKQAVRVPKMESQGAKTRARSRPKRSERGADPAAPSRIGDALQGQHHHQIQLGAPRCLDQGDDRQRMESGQLLTLSASRMETASCPARRS